MYNYAQVAYKTIWLGTGVSLVTMDRNTTPSSSRSEMVNAVSELVFSVSSSLKQETADLGTIAIEDVLTQLESTDTNFHR